MSRQVAKSIAYCVFLRSFWTNFNSTVLSKNFSEALLQQCALQEKGCQLNKRSQNVNNTKLDMPGALKSTLPFLHKFQPFLPDDTIFLENMKRYARCLKIIRAACFFTDSCHENFPQERLSSCCQPFSLSQ